VAPIYGGTVSDGDVEASSGSCSTGLRGNRKSCCVVDVELEDVGLD